MTALTRYVVEVSPAVRDTLVDNRERGHVHVLSPFPRDLGDCPRSRADVLWHLDPPASTLVMQSSLPPERPEVLGRILESTSSESPGEGDRITVRLAINCQKTPPSNTPVELREDLKQGKAYRSRLVIVPEEDRTSWITKRFAAIGFEVEGDSISVGPLQTARLKGRRRGIPYVEVSATGTVRDAQVFSQRQREGLGKGKNYGLGLLRVSPVSSDSL